MKKFIGYLVPQISGNYQPMVILLLDIFISLAKIDSPISINNTLPLLKQSLVNQIDVPHWSSARPPKLTTVQCHIKQTASDSGGLSSFITIANLGSLVYQFKAYPQMFPLETVNFIILIHP